jgi:hypothetical protein
MMKWKSTDEIPHAGTPIGAACGLTKLGHLTASSALCGNRSNRVSLCDCQNGSPRLNGVTDSRTRTIFALSGPMRRNNTGGSRSPRVLPTGFNSPSVARFVASPSTQDADTPATEMLPHIVIRGIGILPRRCERTPSWISPGEPPFRNLFLKPLRLCPSHGVAERQPCVPMGMNRDHNSDVPPCAGLFPGLFPQRAPLAVWRNSAGATLPVVCRRMITRSQTCRGEVI